MFFLEKKIILGSITVLITIIIVSGCIYTTSNTTKTFSDGFMSFTYPGDFNNITDEENLKSNSSMQIISELYNDKMGSNHKITVGRNRTAISIPELTDKNILTIKNEDKGKILSITNESNSNGIVVEKITYIEPVFMINYMGVDMFLKSMTPYMLSVSGGETRKQKIINTVDMIFQSIK